MMQSMLEKLRHAWASALDIEPDEIHDDDSFFDLGGSSVMAIWLVGDASQDGLPLTVEDLYRSQDLAELAALLEAKDSSSVPTFEPFSLLPSPISKHSAQQAAASQCKLSADAVQDVLPCTPLQETLLAATASNPGLYVRRHAFKVPSSVDLNRLRSSWETVAARTPALRTRVIELEGLGLAQIILDERLGWHEHDSLASYEKEEDTRKMHLGTPLTWLSLVRESDHSHLIWTIHHSLYDAWSIELVLRHLESIYRLESLAIEPLSLHGFVQYAQQSASEQSLGFWREQFEGVNCAQYPSVPPLYRPKVDTAQTHYVWQIPWQNHNFSPDTIIRASLALLLAQQSAETEALFGAVTAGRKAPVGGVERMAGPTIATVPLRIVVDYENSVGKFLRSIQDQEVNMIPHEQTGLQRLKQISNDAALCCDFQTLLVVQQKKDEKTKPSTSLLSPAEDLLSQGSERLLDFASSALLLECEPLDHGLQVRVACDSSVISAKQVARLCDQLGHIAQRICNLGRSSAETRLRDLSLISKSDLQDIWHWNPPPPAARDQFLDDLILHAARRAPKAQAVYAWDGTLTYGELDDFSARLAGHLAQQGIVRGSTVAICTPKTKWIPVALLGVLRTGATIMTLDTLAPPERAALMLDRTNARILLTAFPDDLPELPSNIQCFDLSNLPSLDVEPLTEHPQGRPKEDVAYICFTSGSTGEPKGVVIEHAVATTNVEAMADCYGLKQGVRMLFFSSLAFDAYIFEVYSGLARGGCLCIPSEDHKLDMLAEFIDESKAEACFLTPTVLQTLSPEDVPTMKTIVCGGEAVKADVANEWAPHADFIVAYGPTETCCMSVFHRIFETHGPPPIGRGITTNNWIVDPDDDTRLQPVGAVGELLVEGETLSKGYLNNPDRTAEVFITDPSWLLAGDSEGRNGRSGRLYKTGDLVRFLEDGSLAFIGRKDTQIKIRGQRVELGEIEERAKRSVNPELVKSVAVEHVAPQNAPTAVLLAFICVFEHMAYDDLEIRQAARNMRADMSLSLPSYMLPSHFISIDSMPLMATGKMDRRRLRGMAESMLLSDIASLEDVGPIQGRAVETKKEKQLQGLWADVLNNKDAENISADDSFIQLGGDSLSAIKLSAMARRKEGLMLEVPKVLSHPRLSDLAETMEPVDQTNVHQDEPFSLLGESEDVESACAQSASLCNVDTADVLDIFGCTSLQEGLLSLSTNKSGEYTLQRVFRIDPTVDSSVFQAAWAECVERLPNLRTRIVDMPKLGLVQVVLRSDIQWDIANDLTSYVRKDRDQKMQLGSPLFRLGLVVDNDAKERYFVLTLHHAMYDAFAMADIVDTFVGIYKQQNLSESVPFKHFIKYLRSLDGSAAERYWTREVEDFDASVFPSLPSEPHQPKDDNKYHYAIEHVEAPESSTLSTAIRSTLAILLSHYTGTSDTIFGAVVSGRQAPLWGVERIAGPTLATVPVRVNVDSHSTQLDFMTKVQQQAAAMVPFEQSGLSFIRNINNDAKQACSFQTLLVVQTPSETAALGSEKVEDVMYEVPEFEDKLEAHHPYGLTIVCNLNPSSVSCSFQYDSALLGAEDVERFAHQFEHLLRQLCNSELALRPLHEMDLMSPNDIQTLGAWNGEAISPAEITMRTMIESSMRDRPDAIAICAWDGEFKYQQLDQLSLRLALHLTELGIGPNTVAILAFEKSSWTAVAQTAVMRAGGTSVMLDISQPMKRLESIVQQVEPKVVLASPTSHSWASELLEAPPVIVDHENMAKLHPRPQASLPTLSVSDNLCIIFTSGSSSGTPKGIVLTHENFATMIEHTKGVAQLTCSSRVFDFASYAFDISWWNVLLSFGIGACLCVPSEADRHGDIDASIRSLQATYLAITPTVSRMLQPGQLPSVHTLHLGGEAASHADIARWDTKNLVIHGYGPAECSVWLTHNDRPLARQSHIGKAYGARTWITRPDNPSRLALLGGVGELWIESPTVAAGYKNAPQLTADAFFDSPPWSSHVHELLPSANAPGRSYRTGDLVRYLDDGSLKFCGRKDQVVKIRGQKVDLEEIEQAMRTFFTSSDQDVKAAAQVTATRDKRSPIVLAFLASPLGSNYNGTPAELLPETLVSDLHQTLARQLPIYMLPTAYLFLQDLPTTTTGKTDRRRLGDHASSLSMKQILQSSLLRSTRQPPETSMEKEMQKMWAHVLGIQADEIGATDSFLEVGGDSVAAMRLISAARRQGINISAPDVFRSSSLRDVAKAAIKDNSASINGQDLTPFQLFGQQDSESIRHETAKLCEVELHLVQDAFPCSSLQEGLMALSLQREAEYVGRIVRKLDRNVDVGRLRRALERTQSSDPIFRTRIVDLPGQGFAQAIINLPISHESYSTLDDFEHAQPLGHPKLGSPLSTLAVIGPDEADHVYLAIIIHHAIYDGHSISMVLKEIESAYEQDATPQPPPPYQAFIEYLSKRDPAAEAEFWKQQLLGVDDQCFPKASPLSGELSVSLAAQHEIRDLSWPTGKSTPSAAVSSALALLLSNYCGSPHALFGAILSGRQAPVNGIEAMTGPTTATVPMHIAVDGQESVQNYLEAVQRQSIEITANGHYGLQQIRSLGETGARGCNFGTLLAVQPDDSNERPDGLFEARVTRHSQGGELGLNTYPLVFEVALHANSADVRLFSDSRILSHKVCNRIAHQFEHVLRQLGDPQKLSVPLNELDMVAKPDEDNLWRWNAHVPVLEKRLTHQHIEHHAHAQPDATAVEAYDGQWTYQELQSNALRLAKHLQSIGIKRGQLLPVCFPERSKWTVASMLAAMTIGITFVPLDSRAPEERLRSNIARTSAQHVLTDATSAKILEGITDIETLNPANLAGQDDQDAHPIRSCDTPNADDLIYVMFTSGSTGEPKGVRIPHAGLVTSLLAHGRFAGFDSSTRMLHFSSLSFDACITEILTTLVSGGCVCIPSEDEKMASLSEFISKHNVNTALLTPRVLRTIQPSQVPSLRTVFSGGEALPLDLARSWCSNVRLINAYGPTETCIIAALANIGPEISGTSLPIGRNVIGPLWVVNAENVEQPLGPGMIGELLIETNAIAKGYLNDESKTKESFIDPPTWLVEGRTATHSSPGGLYRTGDLVWQDDDGKIYYTGRRDGQVKIRGQRVELAEVTSQIERLLEFDGISVKDVITVLSDKQKLATFICPQNASNRPNEQLRLLVSGLTATLAERLSSILPGYMVPSRFIASSALPLTAGGKSDLRKLSQMATNEIEQDNARAKSEIGQSKQQQQAKESTPPVKTVDTKQPKEAAVEKLRELCSSVLKVDSGAIDMNAKPTSLGIESILAVKLSSAARRQGIQISVKQILSCSRLSELAKNVAETSPTPDQSNGPVPLGLLRDDTNSSQVRKQAAQMCAVPEAQIEDVFPMSELQQGLLGSTAKSDGSGYYYRQLHELQPHIELDRFKSSWERVVEHYSILRTRAVALAREGLCQAVVREKLVWPHYGDVDECMEAVKQHPTDLGSPLAHFAIVNDAKQGRRYFFLSLHHALYDGHSLNNILDRLSREYQGLPLPPVVPFQSYVSQLLATDSTAAERYWKDYCAGTKAVQFPRVREENQRTHADTMVSHRISEIDWTSGFYTAATYLRACLAITIAQRTDIDDSVFGEVVTGREVFSTSLDVENVAGPTIATVPVRLALSRNESVDSTLHRTQTASLDRMPYEHLGLRRISRLNNDTSSACNFQTLFAVQPQENPEENSDPLFVQSTDQQQKNDIGNFTSYALTVICSLEQTGLTLRLFFNESVLSENEAHDITQDFETSLRHLMAHERHEKSQALDLIDLSSGAHENSHKTSGVSAKVASVPVCNGHSPDGSTPQALNEEEQRLAEIYSDALDIPLHSIGPDDNFTAHGGDSISAMLVASRSREIGIHIKVPDLLGRHTIRSLVKNADVNGSMVNGDSTHSDNNEAFHLSPVQQMHFEAHPHGINHYNQAVIRRIHGDVSSEQLRQATEHLVKRHEMLRARFAKSPRDSWKQSIVPYNDDVFRFEISEMENISMLKEAASNRQKRLDIVNGPVFSCDIFCLPDASRILLLIAHHLVVDIVSWQILLLDFERALRTKASSPPQTTFRSWCALQQRPDAPPSTLRLYSSAPASNHAYWGLPQHENTYAEIEMWKGSLDATTTRLLLDAKTSMPQVDPLDILLGCIHHSFTATFTDRQVPSIFAEEHGRALPESDIDVDVSDTVGWFTSMHPMTAAIPSHAGVVQAIEAFSGTRTIVQSQSLAYLSSVFNTDKTSEWCSKYRSQWPIEILLNYFGKTRQEAGSDSLLCVDGDLSAGQQISGDAKRGAYFEISASIDSGRLELSMLWNRNMKFQSRIDQWAESLLSTLKGVAKISADQRQWLEYSIGSSNVGLVKSRLADHRLEIGDIESLHAATALQQHMVQAQQSHPGVYHVGFDFAVPVSNERRNTSERLHAAWLKVVRHHRILRTLCLPLDSQSTLNVVLRPECVDVELFTNVLRVDYGDTEVHAQLVLNHTVIDHPSLGTIMSDLSAAYYGKPQSLISREFSEVVPRILQMQEESALLEFWKQRLPAAKPCIVPANTDTSMVTKNLTHVTDISSDLHSIRNVAQRNGTTVVSFVHAAWARTLAVHLNTAQAVFGSVVNIRDQLRTDEQDVVGPCIGINVCAIPCDSQTSPAEILDWTHQYLLDSRESQLAALPATAQYCDGREMFNTIVNYRKFDSGKRIESAEVDEVVDFKIEKGTDPWAFDVVLSAAEIRDSLELKLEFYSGRIDETTVKDLLRTLREQIDLFSKG